MIHKNHMILAIFLFIYCSSTFGQNTYLNSIIQNIKGNQDELNKSISMRDSNNYVIFALWDWRKSGRISGMPIIVKQDTILKYPYERYVKKYFSDSNRFFSIDIGGQTSGIIKFQRWPNSAGVKFQLIDFDSTSIIGARNTHQNYLAIASTLFPSSPLSSKQYGKSIDKQKARLIALMEFKSDGIDITNPDKIEVVDVQLINPKGTDSSYIFGVFKYHEKLIDNTQIHYLSLFYSLKRSKPNFILKEHSQFDSRSYKGARKYFFLDVIDYDFDGKDEFLIIESGYEHMDVILFELENKKLIEVYRVPTSMS